jgi:hypothetical protein
VLCLCGCWNICNDLVAETDLVLNRLSFFPALYRSWRLPLYHGTISFSHSGLFKK